MHIIVLGMHRSGTSTVTRLINLMGAYVGKDEELIGANEENPKGFWERQDVIKLNDALLAHHQCSWSDVSAWPYADATPKPLPNDELKAECDYIIAQLSASQDWVMKDPRLSHTLPYWLHELDEPTLVYVHRDPLEIAHSLQTRNKMPLQLGLMLWQAATTEILNSMASMPMIHVNYRDLIESPVETTHTLFNALKEKAEEDSTLAMPEAEAITSFIEPSLYRSKMDGVDRSQCLSAHQQALLGAIESQDTSKTPYSIDTNASSIMKLGGEMQRLYAMKEEFERNQQTLKEQELRITQLWGDLNTSQLNNERLQTVYDEQVRINAELRTQISLQGPLVEELKMIKNTRFWKLRNFILRQRDSNSQE